MMPLANIRVTTRRRAIVQGERVLVIAPYSEAMMSAGLAGRIIAIELLPGLRSAQIYDPEVHSAWGAPYLPSEVGVLIDGATDQSVVAEVIGEMP